MPVYAAILYTRDLDWTAPEQAEVTQAYNDFGQLAAGAIQGGAALFPTSTATTVRVSGGKGGEVVVGDGPFAEAKEVLGGFYLLDAADLDDAVRLASAIPAAWDGAVELRPVIPRQG